MDGLVLGPPLASRSCRRGMPGTCAGEPLTMRLRSLRRRSPLVEAIRLTLALALVGAMWSAWAGLIPVPARAGTDSAAGASAAVSSLNVPLPLFL